MSDKAANEQHGTTYLRIRLHCKKETENLVHFSSEAMMNRFPSEEPSLTGVWIGSGIRQLHRSMLKRPFEPDQFGNLMAMPLLRLNALNHCRQPENYRHLFR
ncbi:uncharacterized protein FFB14_11824 [Fusarium fujikuroi]|nr:uncharacterized protein FFB14_11824 [Fusarium fujikuroi]